MDSVTVCHSDSHPIDIDTFRTALDDADITVSEVTVEPGGVDTDVASTLVGALRDSQALYIRTGEVTREIFEAVDGLELVVTSGSGFDHIDLDAATDHDVVVAHQPNAPAPGVVEHTYGLLFSMLSDLPSLFTSTRDGDWQAARGERPEFGSRTFGVVGLGTIGLPVARIASRSFGATVLGYDPFVSGDRESRIYPRYDRDTVEDAGVTLVSKDALFERSDVVSLHVPLREDSRHLVSTTELAALGDGYLINAARGPVVDEEALIDTLSDGGLSGAALDVLESEPPDPGDPLLDYDRVNVTPHVAAWTETYLERSATLAAEKVTALARDEVPETIVNPGVLDR